MSNFDYMSVPVFLLNIFLHLVLHDLIGVIHLFLPHFFTKHTAPPGNSNACFLFNSMAVLFHPGNCNEMYNSFTHFHLYSCSVAI